MTPARCVLQLLTFICLGADAPAQQDPAAGPNILERAAKLLDGLMPGLPARTSPAPKPPRTATIAEAVRLAGTGERAKVRGTLLMETAPGFFFLRDATGGVRGNLVKPIAMQPGDLLEVVAEPILSGGAPWLVSGEAVNLGRGTLPEPVPMRVKEAYASPEDRLRLDAGFVTLRGVIAGHSKHTGRYRVNGIWTFPEFHVLEVDDDGVRVRVFFHPEDGAWELFSVGTVAQFTGTCRLEPKIPDEGAGAVHLLVPDAGHVKVLQLPPFWSRPGVQQGLRISLIALGGMLALGMAWALGQRRKVKALRASEEKYRVLSQNLEKRVNERTAQLEAALAQQTELARLKTDFVSLVSHEFRTPLGVIMSAADVLKRYFHRLPEEKRERHLDMILRSTRNLAQLIEEVLLLGSAEEGRLPFAPVPLDLEKLFRALTDELFSATGGACPIQFHAAPPLDGAICDESLLRHILSNLLSNAVKYSEPGQPVAFTAARDGSDLILTVRDHGIGIPPEEQSRIFQSFTRASNVGQRPGTGLGLVIVQRCVVLHGGTVHLESTAGTGTFVTVSLPVFAQLSTLNSQPK